MNNWVSRILACFFVLSIAFGDTALLGSKKVFAQEEDNFQINENNDGLFGSGIQIEGVFANLAGCYARNWLLSKTYNPKDAVKDEVIVNGQTVETVDDLLGALGGGASAVTSVPVNDSELIILNTKIENKLADIRVDTIKTKTTTYGDAARQSCLKRATKYLLQQIMDRMTLDLVNWINSGFEGRPFYPQNKPGQLLSIWKEEVIGVFGELTYDGTLSPFIGAVIESMLVDFQRDFQRRLQHDLNDFLAGWTHEEFRADFTAGGWVGYTAAFEPQNNIFGQYLLVNQEIGRRTEGTSVSAAINFREELRDFGGFVSMSHCTATAFGPVGAQEELDYFKEDHPLHISPEQYNSPFRTVSDIPPHIMLFLTYEDDPDTAINEAEPTYNGQTVVLYVDSNPLNGAQLITPEYDPDLQLKIAREIQRKSICRQRETDTPGSLVSDMLSDSPVGNPFRQLELTDDFEENVGLILDALFNQLLVKGLSELYCDEGQGNCSTDPNDPDYNVLVDQVNGGSPGYGDSNDGDPLIVAITGAGSVDQALTVSPADAVMIQTQQNYLTQLQVKLGLLNEKLTLIAQLDYCVPGPNPLWFASAQSTLSQAMSSVQNVTYLDFMDDNGNDVNDSLDDVRAYYADVISDLAGLQVSQNSAPETYTELGDFMESVFLGYAEEINNTFPINGTDNPTQRPESNSYYSDGVSLLSEYASTEEQIGETQNVITELTSILLSLQGLSVDQNENLSPDSPQIQSYTAISGSIVGQSTVNSIDLENSMFLEEISDINGTYTSCASETANGGYPYSKTRTAHTLLEQVNFTEADDTYAYIQGPNDESFLPNIEVGAGDGEVDLSGTGVTVVSDANFGNTFDVTLGNLF